MKELRIIIAGKRDFYDFNRLSRFCDNIIKPLENSFSKITIISGNALGTDRMGEEYAKQRNYNLIIFPAKWFEFGKKAGPIRNSQMADYAISDNAEALLIAFWNGESKGTADMINKAKNKNMKIFIDYINKEEK